MVRKPASEWSGYYGDEFQIWSGAAKRWRTEFRVDNERDIFYAKHHLLHDGDDHRIARTTPDGLVVFGGREDKKNWEVHVNTLDLASFVVLEFPTRDEAHACTGAINVNKSKHVAVFIYGPDGKVD